jgi:hypothetical protein
MENLEASEIFAATFSSFVLEIPKPRNTVERGR